MRLPDSGLDANTVLRTLETMRAGDVSWRDGQTWAYVYDPGPEAEAVSKEAFVRFLSENALDPTSFPSTLALENAIVGILAQHLNGAPNAVGSFTSGGTESIFCAVKAARDAWRATHPDGRQASIVVADTAHAAFHKAAHFLDIHVILVPVVPGTFRADPVAMAAAIGPETCLVVASAPSYPHGVVDPVREIAAAALTAGVRCHVDGCVGGFMLPYFRRLGAEIPDFDFSVPGVTSISVDLHKYGFAPKGASVVLHRDAGLRRHQIYACSAWAGYTIVNTTVQSTRSGGPMAAAWATLHFIGDAGYLALAERMRNATARVVAGVSEIAGLSVMGQPDMNMLAVTSTDGTSVFNIVDEMKLRGWTVQPQLAFGSSRENIHLSVNATAPERVEPMLRALRESVEAARPLPSGQVSRAVAARFGERLAAEYDERVFFELMILAGVQGLALPERMAGINEALNALSPGLREQVLVDFANLLYVQR